MIYLCFSHFNPEGNAEFTRDSRGVGHSGGQKGVPEVSPWCPSVKTVILLKAPGEKATFCHLVKTVKTTVFSYFLAPFPPGFSTVLVKKGVRKRSTAVG